MSSSKAEMQAAETGARLSGIAIVAILLGILVLIGVAIYVSFPATNNHFSALIAIGILGLVVSVLAVLLQAASRDPSMARAASAGSFWFGVAVLLGAGLVAPDGAFSGSACPASGSAGAACQITFGSIRIVYLIVVLLIVVAGLLYMRWQLQGRARDAAQESHRAAWRAKSGVQVGTPGAGSPNDPRTNPP
ncbi:MAG: hypothetical protein KGJ23_01780 [Euryarchaeota archaeon]|nr:hypothetical protein [Euryarchaeota archaeon]MDE1835325.1 hypothetical protein [Euryarchaeota archaeon]MDE1880780.1 hypothetical protein [Euryarchaeota archaeon]MDE2043621.1 hypothetical protein [Thermoplasmata archaeon]